MPRYNPAEIEPRWQAYWADHQTWKTPEMPTGEKLYVLDMFPYPSGAGLHVGHPEGYTATDIVARTARMQGKTVLHPMGYDAFGLPAEEHAIRTNTPPAVSTAANIANFTRQLQMLGFSYDWSRMVATTDPDYFKWTQWIFLLIYDTWFDPVMQKGRPIAELPIPAEVSAGGETAVDAYRDKFRLAYQDDALVNWCPALGTVLANEEVKEGRSEVGGHPVQRIPLRQWMLRITAYADRLLNDLQELDWPVGIKKLQEDWIGRSQGAEIDFYCGDQAAYEAWKAKRSGSDFPAEADTRSLRVYTTRPDTLWGATYMVIAPEHPLALALTTDAQKTAVEAYVRAASFKSDRARAETDKEKTGVFTGSYAINPINDQPIPVWIADYVLAGYGTGAIMAVPAHDSRDYEFATAFNLPVVEVVRPADGEPTAGCFAGEGVAINSGPYDGRATVEVAERITGDLAAAGIGRAASNTKLRDWLFSRQRFWGEPFPILHEVDAAGNFTGIKRAVPVEQLPVNLPQLEDFKPHGRPEPPLAKAPEEWLYVELDGRRWRRETNTMPQWAGSCWYYLRYIDPHNSEQLIAPEKEAAWMPVDLYVGGAEHAVLHLLYSRFWHKVLFDRGVVRSPEPFAKLINQGMILGEVEYTVCRNDAGEYFSVGQSRTDADGQLVHRETGISLDIVSLSEEECQRSGNNLVMKDRPDVAVDARSFKMSKSRGNVINPDDIVGNYGADSLRLYEMFMGPLEATKPWSTAGVSGVRGFLDRLWRLIIDDRQEQLQLSNAIDDSPLAAESQRVLHATIKHVTEDIASLSFNTAIARLMEAVNHFTKLPTRNRDAMRTLVLLVSPFAPHIAEELWMALGGGKTLAYEPWPRHDAAALVVDSIEVPVQINGKLRSRISVPPDADAAAMEAAALADEKIAAQLAGHSIVKKVIVPGKLVNFVVR